MPSETGRPLCRNDTIHGRLQPCLPRRVLLARMLLTCGILSNQPNCSYRHRTRVMSSRFLCSIVLSLILAGAACVKDPMQFSAQYASGFTRDGLAVSVFGVFKDGRMSADSWDHLGPALSMPHGPSTCKTGYGKDLASANPALSSALDDYSRANGITEELLDRIGPLAQGDVILVITMAGHPPRPMAGADAGASKGVGAQSSGQGGQGGGSGRHRRQQGSSTHRANDAVADVFQMSASFFSVRLHQSVAVVNMTYSGPSLDEAVKAFADRLQDAVPHSRCGGWNWEAQGVGDQIRQLMAQ